jgi:hypothetical protein
VPNRDPNAFFNRTGQDMLNILSGGADMDSIYLREGTVGGLEASCYPEGRISHEKRITLHF